MKPNSAWYANSQRIRILIMSVISGHEHRRVPRTVIDPCSRNFNMRIISIQLGTELSETGPGIGWSRAA